jgi:Tfp pilus assembly protein PilX
MKKEKGQMVLVMLMLTVVIAIIIPALVYYVQQETRGTVKETKSTRAFHLAEAAMDRAVYKLNESIDTWNNAYQGIAIAGYDGQTVYSDMAGGVYKIKFSSGPGQYYVTVVTSGKDANTNECRTLQCVFYRGLSVEGGLTSTHISANGSADVHWDSIMSQTSLELKGSVSGKKYPRKYARGYISPRYTSGPLPKYGSLADEDLAEWHAGYDVPDLPSIDLPMYETESQKVTGATAGGTPAGSSYYIGDKLFSNLVDNTTRVYYVTGDLTMKNCHLEGTLIVRGSLSNSGTDKGSDVIANVPSDAWKEYQEEVNDTSAIGQYPADSGYHQVSATYNIGKTMFKGLVYVGGSWNATGNPQINGVVIVAGSDGFTGTGNPIIWSDKNVAENIRVISLRPLKRLSWKELQPKWNL